MFCSMHDIISKTISRNYAIAIYNAKDSSHFCLTLIFKDYLGYVA